MINYLEKLKEKCIVNKEFYNIVEDIFNKLLEFGYTTPKKVKKLQKKLYDNIDVVLLGGDVKADYKTGYYDSVKKELYIKDLSNIESVYLRILYAITTTKTSKDNFDVGYSTASLSDIDYKIHHLNFGINRAVVSNLVCRLLYTTPTTLSIMPTYRTYENDFLGNKISSDNDIYFLEGILLRQICYILNLSEENLYLNLFEKPNKYLHKFFRKISEKNISLLLTLLDKISRNYSTYNKLVFLNKMLNENYINIKKRILDNDVKDLELEKENINLAIQTALEKVVSKKAQDDELQPNIESCLAEEILRLENEIINDITSLQSLLVTQLIESEEKYNSIDFAIKLKQLERILILKDEKLHDAIYNTISLKLMTTFEDTASNMVEKMKYSIINEILSSDKYIKIYKNMKFNKIESVNFEDKNTCLAVLSVDNSFLQLVKIDSLQKNMKDLRDNTVSLNIENMAYLLNNPSVTKDVHVFEQIFTIIHTKFPDFSNVRIENMFFVNVEKNILIIVMHDDTFTVLNVIPSGNSFNIKKSDISEFYSIFNLKNMSNLPVIYNKKETTLQKVLSFFTFFA